MSSWFDTAVQYRRNHTPWASVGMLKFMKEMLWNESEAEWADKPLPEDRVRGVVFTMVNRPDVASRVWYTIEWTGYDGKRYNTSSQEFDLLMWRAAETEMKARARVERDEEPHKNLLATRILAIADSGDLEALAELAKELRGE